MNRSIAPNISTVSNIVFPNPVIETLDNGVQFYSVSQGDQDVVRLDLLFEAGKWDQSQALTAVFVAGLLKEGTKDYAATEISEMLDETGSYLQANSGMHHTIVSLYSLNKHFAKMCRLLQSVIVNPLFDESEFDTFKNKKYQQFRQESEKVKMISAQNFKQKVFGGDNPYGFITTKEDYQSLNTEHLKTFHRQKLTSDNSTILLSGKVTSQTLQEVKRAFSNKWGTPVASKQSHTFKTQPKGNVFIKKDDAVQSAINMGLSTVSKTDDDFLGLQITNTILGGYFGSRLMKNIRENKGYTYGIGSALIPFRKAGLLSIYTETANDFRDKVIDEIHKEVSVLRTQEVSHDELELVKNYLRGELIRGTDHVFQMADNMHALIEFKLTTRFLQTYLDTINNITPTQILSLADTYLNPDNFHTVIAGG